MQSIGKHVQLDLNSKSLEATREFKRTLLKVKFMGWLLVTLLDQGRKKSHLELLV
jgi:hypothetical protein